MTTNSATPTFDIDDRVGAWVPHGRFVVDGAAEGPLKGLRFAAKDLFDVAGHTTGAGNPTWLATHEPAPAHALLVGTMLGAGAQLMGKTVTDELAYSLHGDNHHYGAPLNTRAPDRVTGGSSSGSAAAAAAQLVDFALATDTGGSTRVPSSYCGLWGLRPTHGLVSSVGLVPLNPTYDTPTWLAHDGAVFERVAQLVLPPSSWQPARLLMSSDAWAMADADFQGPLAKAMALLASLLGLTPQPSAVARDDALPRWRQLYTTHSGYGAWKVHGDWIRQHAPVFGPGIAERWAMSANIDERTGAQAAAGMLDVRERVRAWVGDDAIALLPSAASFALHRNATAAEVDDVRKRTMAITCIAGSSGLPQVSLPWPGATAAPLALSLLGPVGSDLALVRLARQLQQALCALELQPS